MHAAPPVRVSLAPDAACLTIVIGCAAAASANVAAWLGSLAQRSAPEIAALALLGAGLAAALAWPAMRRGFAGQGVLAWDGAVWQWAPDEAQSLQPNRPPPTTGELRVMIDLGAWILLRFEPSEPGQRARWITVSRQQGRALWPLWRAALFSHRPGAEPTDAAGRP